MNIEKLIVTGYFHEELLPVFTPEDLKKVIIDVLVDLDNLDPVVRTKKQVISKCLSFSIPKVSGYRRNLSIPNPLHYIRISQTISDNWANILRHTEKSTISISRLDLGSKRAISRPNFDELINGRIIRSVGSRFLLKIDISRFYSSIYTHSIPWALPTKATAKVHRKRTPNFGNALDEDSRKMQDGQTIGIPVGPDSSRIISEIILSSIDQELADNLPEFKGIRIIDDYYLYFNSLSDVELARSVVHKTLRDYELELNPKKESVLDIPEVMESVWYKDLKTVRFSNDHKLQRKELIAFFDKAFFHAKQFTEDAVLSYAISKIRPTIFNEKNLIILQSLLLNSIVQESRTISLLAEILISYNAKKHKLDLNAIKFAIEQFIIFHNDLNNEFETSWALGTLKLSVSEETAKKLSSSSNSIVILVCLDLKQAGLIKKGLNYSLWRTMLNRENLYSEHWLLAYEAKLRGWLKTSDDYLEDDPFFKILKNKKVHFYKPRKTLDTSRVRAAAYNQGVPEVIIENVIRAVSNSKREDLPFYN